MLKEKYEFFTGTQVKLHVMVLELLEYHNLWQISIQSEENQHLRKNPEEIFLLQSVEQILTGVDTRFTNVMPGNSPSEDRQFVQFCFRNPQQTSVGVVFCKQEDYDFFIKKIALIVKNKYHQEPSQFIMKQSSTRIATEAMRMRNRRYSWVEPENLNMIEKLTTAMRANHTGLNIGQSIFSPQEQDETSVEWVTQQLGKPCNPSIRFKVLFFKNQG